MTESQHKDLKPEDFKRNWKRNKKGYRVVFLRDELLIANITSYNGYLFVTYS